MRCVGYRTSSSVSNDIMELFWTLLIIINTYSAEAAIRNYSGS